MSKKKVGLAASEISEKWNRRMKQAIPDMVKGVNAVSESPMEAAAAKEDKMLMNLTKAVTNGVWAAQLRKVSLAEWKGKTSKKIQERLAGGVDAGMDKRKSFDSWMVNRLDSILPEIQGMPDLTLQDSIARMTAMVTHMAEEKYRAA